MMSKPSVSVIIPVYNTEPYLAECLDSVINQSIQEIEIIVVNDGSTDGSLDILQRYCSLDDRIVLLNKANQGASAARNDALQMAKADYIMFLDSDDFFAVDTAQTAYNQIWGNSCDIMIFNGRAFEDDGQVKHWHKKSYFNLFKKDENCIAPGLYWIERTGGRIQQPGMKIYRREFITNNDLKFGDSLVGEDYFFFYMCMIKAASVGYFHFEGYCRRYRSSSHMTDESIHGTQQRIKSFGQIMSTLNFVKDEQCRRKIASQHAYYASVLWIRCLIRHDVSERNSLLKSFHNCRLGEYVQGNRNDWRLNVLSFFISLPEYLLWMKIIFARTIQKAFKSKTRLL